MNDVWCKISLIPWIFCIFHFHLYVTQLSNSGKCDIHLIMSENDQAHTVQFLSKSALVPCLWSLQRPHKLETGAALLWSLLGSDGCRCALCSPYKDTFPFEWWLSTIYLSLFCVHITNWHSCSSFFLWWQFRWIFLLFHWHSCWGQLPILPSLC